ncbi:hypothetical protein [Massilia sp. S19_KUP03_FR1]|uniref:hypothetical protein n=1 Tax=Massilia sp. S19_KUP03_FR1 TaxID=3025503 RepID=UPI002FCDB38D
MTLFTVRTGAALFLAASLAACGGGSDKAKFPVSGTVSGLYYDSLTLTTGSQTLEIKKPGLDSSGVANVVNYTFPQILEYGDVYFVKLVSNPAHQSCSVLQTAADSAGHTASINVSVTCSINAYTVNGYISGLKGDGLTLINGSLDGTLTPTKATVDANAATEAAAEAAAVAAGGAVGSGAKTPSFSFATAVGFDQAYGVTILAQPKGQHCTVTNGAGLMKDAAVLNIAVKCEDNPA